MATQRTLAALTLLATLAYSQQDPCAPSCPVNNVLHPHPRSCVHYYHCSNGAAILRLCPAGLHFSSIFLRCDYPSTSRCTALPNAICASPAPTSPSTPVVSKCVPPCPSTSALYPHPHDCTSFFHCSNSVPYLKQCPAGQHFSVSLLRCENSAIAKCNDSASNPCVAVTNPPTTPSPASRQCTPTCPWPNVYMAHPQNCTQFYMCNGMEPYEFSCHTGLHFDIHRLRCELPQLANCTSHPLRACNELLRL